MKLVGELKKQVEETKNKEEAKELIENAGMLLTDDELDNVAGGGGKPGECDCSPNKCHEWVQLHLANGALGPKECKYCHAKTF